LLIADQNGHGPVVRMLLDARGSPADGLQVWFSTGEMSKMFWS
jgi:hypothetical protein